MYEKTLYIEIINKKKKRETELHTNKAHINKKKIEDKAIIKLKGKTTISSNKVIYVSKRRAIRHFSIEMVE